MSKSSRIVEEIPNKNKKKERKGRAGLRGWSGMGRGRGLQ